MLKTRKQVWQKLEEMLADPTYPLEFGLCSVLCRMRDLSQISFDVYDEIMVEIRQEVGINYAYFEGGIRVFLDTPLAERRESRLWFCTLMAHITR